MSKLSTRIESKRPAFVIYLNLPTWTLLLAVTLSAQGPEPGLKQSIVRQLSSVKFPAGEGPDCLQFFLENGDLKTVLSRRLGRRCRPFAISYV
jgi:hypothetical protein